MTLSAERIELRAGDALGYAFSFSVSELNLRLPTVAAQGLELYCSCRVEGMRFCLP